MPIVYLLEFNNFGIITLAIFESKHPYITSFKNIFEKKFHEVAGICTFVRGGCGKMLIAA